MKRKAKQTCYFKHINEKKKPKKNKNLNNFNELTEILYLRKLTGTKFQTAQ